MSKKGKIILAIIEILIMVVLIVGWAIVGKQHKTIKTKELRIEQLMSQREELLDNIEKLGAESVLSVTCNINIKSTNVMGVNTINSNNLAKEISQMTRKELYDSLYGPKRDVPFEIDTLITKDGAKVVTGKIKK